MDKIDRKLFIKQICAEELEEYRTKKAIKVLKMFTMFV